MMRNMTLVLQLFLVLTLSQFHTTVFASETKTYRNDQLGIEFTYLNTWERSNPPGNHAFAIERKLKTNPGILSIHVNNFTGKKEKFMDEVKSSPEKLISKLKDRFPGAEILNKGNTFLGSYPAYYILTNYTLKNLNTEIDITLTNIFCIKGTKIFLVNLETPLVHFDKTFEEVISMLATFNFR